MAIVSLRMLSFICFFGILISQTTAQILFLNHTCVNDKGNYTDNSTYRINLSSLVFNLSDSGFYNFSYGQNSDQVNVIGLCRGDVKPVVCRNCLYDSRLQLTRLCPYQKEAISWHDNCMLRYSNRSIFGIMETAPYFYFWNPSDAKEVGQYSQGVRDLLYRLTNRSASGDSLRKFATGDKKGPSNQTIYGLVQCTPDLSEEKCRNCLESAILEIPMCCDGKIGGRVVRPSCNFRYENYLFVEPPSSPPPPLSLPPQVSLPPPSTNSSSTEDNSHGKSNTSRTVIAVVVPIIALLLLFIFIKIYLRLRKPRTKPEKPKVEDDEITTVEALQFDFDSIKDATNNFADSSKLGQGGFGTVYMGRLLNGQEIAVKRLSRDSGQGDSEFKNEVMLVAKLQHRNLVKLLGFCMEGSERLLVYEFVPQKSLDYFIFDPAKRIELDWKRRYKIIGGIARGLLYLHEDSRLRIIHRDLKASNILLDAGMNPKISDFGMARLFVVDQAQGTTNRIVGTYGYMAPEYAMHGHFSVKSDVFSFGVLVLEIISGHKNTSKHHGENLEDLLSFTWRNWKEGTASKIIDPTLLSNSSQSEMMRCIHIGLLCVQENIADRPTMAAVVLMLNSFSISLPLPTKPALFMNNRSLPGMQSREHNSGAAAGPNEPRHNFIPNSESVNEISITELYPR